MRKEQQTYEIRDKIYKFLDKNIIVSGGKMKTLDMSKYTDLSHYDLISGVFGENIINFLEWAEDTYGKSFCVRTSKSDTWFQNGKLHRNNDKPAEIYHSGTRHWYKHGVLHRGGDKPAQISYNGDKVYFKNGRIHRGNGLPAYIMDSGTKIWYQNSGSYRDNDQPTHEWSGGSIEWQSGNNQTHRLIGPAIILKNGALEYWIRGVLLYTIKKYKWDYLDTKENNRIFVPWMKK